MNTENYNYMFTMSSKIITIENRFEIVLEKEKVYFSEILILNLTNYNL